MRKPLKTCLRIGEPLTGAWCTLPAPEIAEMAGAAGFDFVVIDFQHGLIGEDLAADMFRAVEAAGAAAVARAASKDAAHLGRLLDLGAAGVIVPMIDSADEAAEIMRACLYPPHGTRSFGPVRAIKGRDRRAYMEAAEDETCILPMIETAGALAERSAIAAVPGIAGLFVGPADLSLSMELAPAREHQDRCFEDALLSIVDTCKNARIGAGIQAQPGLAARRSKEGFTFITAAMDSALLADGFEQILRAEKSARTRSADGFRQQ